MNGAFVGQSGDLRGEPPKRWEAAQLFPVPRDVLREGPNVFDLRVYTPEDARGGIGTVLLGPHEALYLRALRDELGHAIGPAVASLTITVLGLFMIVLWLRARDDPDYLLFAVACILWGLHTGATLLPREPLPRPHFWVWWNAVYVTFVVLLCLFVVRFTNTRWPRYERGALLYAAASVPVLYAAPGRRLLPVGRGRAPGRHRHRARRAPRCRAQRRFARATRSAGSCSRPRRQPPRSASTTGSPCAIPRTCGPCTWSPTWRCSSSRSWAG